MRGIGFGRWVVGCGLVGVLLLSSVAAAGPLTQQEKEQGFKAIFDGKTLEGWTVMGPNKEAFKAVDGTLYCDGTGGFWIRYHEELANFVLKLEYKLSKTANSGVFLRSKERGHPAYTGSEVQILDSYGEPVSKEISGAIYDVIAPTANMEKPVGEWSEMVITCDGPRVKVSLNGRQVIDADYSKLTEPIGKFKTPYAKLPLKGYIGLQDHGHPLWFRNIKLKKLP